jgi:hypothetical protein
MRHQASRFVIVTTLSALFACASSSVRIKVGGLVKEYPEPNVKKAGIQLRVVDNKCTVVGKSSSVRARRNTDEIIWRIKNECEGDHKLEIRFAATNPMEAGCQLTTQVKKPWVRIFCEVGDVEPNRYKYKIFLDDVEAVDPDVEIYQ